MKNKHRTDDKLIPVIIKDEPQIINLTGSTVSFKRSDGTVLTIPPCARATYISNGTDDIGTINGIKAVQKTSYNIQLPSPAEPAYANLSPANFWRSLFLMSPAVCEALRSTSLQFGTHIQHIIGCPNHSRATCEMVAGELLHTQIIMFEEFNSDPRIWEHNFPAYKPEVKVAPVTQPPETEATIPATEATESTN